MRLYVEALKVLRGTRAVIDELSFSVGSGECLLLTGPNGSGKTTLLRTIGGFIPADGGKVGLEGGDGERSLGEHCHYVGHLNGIKSSLTASGNLAFWARYLSVGDGSDVDARVGVALRRFGLEPLGAVPAGLLSAGQRRRLGLARVLVARRPIWLLDEPTVSLDAVSAKLLADLIGEHVAGGGVLVAATHLPLGIESARFLQLGAAEAA